MIKNYDIFCDKCGKVFVQAIIKPDGDSKNNRPSLKLSSLGWICTSELYSFDRNSLLHIAELIERKDFGELARIDNEAFGFFCRECGKNYCASCWVDVTPVFDDWFYDYTWANCPVGHRQIIND